MKKKSKNILSKIISIFIAVVMIGSIAMPIILALLGSI